jgi:hypothetical protein
MNKTKEIDIFIHKTDTHYLPYIIKVNERDLQFCETLKHALLFARGIDWGIGLVDMSIKVNTINTTGEES